MITRNDLENYIGQLLSVDRFRDYAPNGLQVEGRKEIHTIATAVTASLAAIDAAQAIGADALLVHHGYFWKNEAPAIRGTKKARIAQLLANDLNLFAYHLPLDAHPELGNNATLGALLGLTPTGHFAEQDMGWLGTLAVPLPFSRFTAHVHTMLDHPPLAIGDADKMIHKVAWCTGGAQSYFHEAATLDIDCFITGEASEFVTHLARETGIAYLGAGHHATERAGIRALGDHLNQVFGLSVHHLDIPNPV